MKKLAAAILGLLLLGGCAISEEDLPNQILIQLKGLENQQLAAGNNMKKKYYSYYLPPGVARRDSNELSEVFMKDGYRVIMNFDPSAIVIDSFYKEKEEADTTSSASVKVEFQEPTVKQEDQTLIYTGNYLTTTYQVHPYTLQVVQSKDSYLLYLDGEIVKMYTFVPRAEVESMLKMMIKTMSSLQYDKEAILQRFSMKSLEETNKKSLDYLEQNLPSSGSLSEILSGSDEPGVGDSTEKEK